MSYHIVFRKNGRKIKSMGTYEVQSAAASDAQMLVNSGTVPGDVKVLVEKVKAAVKRARKNPSASGVKPGDRVRVKNRPSLRDRVGTVLRAFDGLVEVDFGDGGWTPGVPHTFARSQISHVSGRKPATRKNPSAARTTDAKVIAAFIARTPAQSKKLSTDGTRLDGNWMGGGKIAWWSVGGVHVDDAGSKAREKVRKAVVRAVPAMYLAPDSQWALSKKSARFVRDARETSARAAQWRGPSRANPAKGRTGVVGRASGEHGKYAVVAQPQTFGPGLVFYVGRVHGDQIDLVGSYGFDTKAEAIASAKRQAGPLTGTTRLARKNPAKRIKRGSRVVVATHYGGAARKVGRTGTVIGSETHAPSGGVGIGAHDTVLYHVKMDDGGVDRYWSGELDIARKNPNAHANPAPTSMLVLGHEVIKDAKGYTVKAYGEVRKTLAGIKSFLKQHVTAEKAKHGKLAKRNPAKPKRAARRKK